ncbi:MAG: polysulfide reductase NrfD [Rhodothermales bacterium]|nr:polysulfide reductase NrfD [Rhodothermales bacterium]MBO6778835.1 polysulfide reductase NrfD [Rhodothermales bacterium]
MNYGFVIDNDSCIGCHACSTACKSENDVPLGVHRTWVKSVETGAYPDVRRSFQVTRCNHCANPPCVRICPVTAMYQRDDGIVEFDQDACIGCKACLQACPYDAIYIDPETGSAAKCHYCAHRVEVGLEPACVVVCPEHAIIAGDLDNPESEISRVVANNKVTVRKPEQGTAPKLFYIGGEDAAMHPTATERAPSSFAWSDVIDEAGGDGLPGTSQGLPQAGPIHIAPGRMAEHMVQVVWNAQHKVPWHWPVPAYLVTKAIAAGVFLLAAWQVLVEGSGASLFAPAAAAVLFLLVTTGLLVFDLEHPTRFLRIITRPQWRSWLVRGAFILIAFSGVATLWVAAEWFGLHAWRPWLLGGGSPLAVGAAAYTAFLFGQAEGRDLWQSSLLPAHMVLQSLLAGTAFLAVLGQDMPVLMVGLLALNLLLSLSGDMWMPHASDTAARAAHRMTRGRYRMHYWLGFALAGSLVPALLAVTAPALLPLAGVLVLLGLFLYEQAFVSAPQEIPNS